MFAQVDAPHAAGTELLQYLVFANGEASPFALQELFGLEISDDPVADEQPGELGRVGRDGVGGAQFVYMNSEAILIDDAALADQFQQFIDRCCRGHRLPERGRIEASYRLRVFSLTPYQL